MRHWHAWPLLFVVVALASILLRVLGIFTDFWLDEIWTVRLVEQASSPWSLFLPPLNHSNSHLLNSLAIYAIGDRPDWLAYRIPALIAGSLAVLALALGAYRRDTLAGMTLLVLAGLCYPLILYASESRGYASAVLFGVLAYAWMSGAPARRLTGWGLAAFYAIVMLGTLSHLSFVYVYLAIAVWSVVDARSRCGDWVRTLRELAAMHLVPAVFMTVLYATYVRGLIMGGGPIYPTSEVVLSTFALSLGFPEQGAFAVAGAVLVGAIALYEIRRLYLERSTLWLFFPLVLVIAPGSVIFAQDEPYLYVRYFLLCIPFLLILLGRFLCRVYRYRPAGPALYAAALVAFTAGNGLRIADFLENGRGQYLEAVSFMARNAASPLITVGGNHQFEITLVLDFYRRYLPDGYRVEYFPEQQWRADVPEWVIVHGLDRRAPAPHLDGVNGRRYAFVRSFWTTRDAESGSNWHLYRMQ